MSACGGVMTIGIRFGAERHEVVRDEANVWVIRPDDEEDGDEPAPSGWNHPNVGMTEEEARGIELGSRVRHPDGGWVANRDGRLVRLDDKNRVMGAE